jgi:hypothetical protein
MATCPHQTPNTADWHAWNVGMLITDLQELEFSARIAVELRTGGTQPTEGLLALESGDSVRENHMTNDELGPTWSRAEEI